MRRTVSEAVRNREYQVWYQPQVDMGTGEIFGAEALVRWRASPKRPAFAGEFYSCPGKERLMPLLDREVLRIVRRGRRGGKKRPGSRPARSLSTFPHSAQERKVWPGREDLLFEITETAKEEEENREIWRFAKQLREEGFRIAMDDYGMGRSTLKMLCQVPFDILKLDRYFISRIGEEKGETILKSTIALAKGPGHGDCSRRSGKQGADRISSAAWLQAGTGVLLCKTAGKRPVFSVPGRRKTAAGGTTMRKLYQRLVLLYLISALLFVPAFCGKPVSSRQKGKWILSVSASGGSGQQSGGGGRGV